MLGIHTEEHECYGIGFDKDKERLHVGFDNGGVDGVTYVSFDTLRSAGFKVPNKEEYNNAQAMAVVEMFVHIWKHRDHGELATLVERAKAVLESRQSSESIQIAR